MSTEPGRPSPHVVPRPGVLKGLGITNIVFAILNTLCIFSMSFWFLAATMQTPSNVVVVNQAPTKGSPTASTAGVPMTAAINPMMGMDDKNFVRFSLAESGVNLITNGLMFATGIGLLNLRGWGVRGWRNLACLKLVLLVLFWGYYIVGVAPGFSEHMAQSVMTMFKAQNLAPGRAPSVADLTRIYSIMNLIVAVGAIVIGSIYPALSLWILSRPGVKAGIVDRPNLEPELS